MEILYGWPLRPFDRAHPVRGVFNDPRIAGSSRSFHFGIDISAPNGAPVYAVRAGEVHLEGGRSLAVVAGDTAYGYWHVVPAVAHRQRVGKHELLGHVEAPWLHLHFAERRAGSYRDPLRPGALSPWLDATRPHVTKIVLSRNGRALAADSIFGAVDVIAEAHQMPPLPVPPPWDGLPVTPGRLRWRVRRGNRTVRPWHTPIDLSKGLLPPDRFSWIYAPGRGRTGPASRASTGSISPTPGAPACSPTAHYRLEVEASDLHGNSGRLELPFTLVNDL